jgi:hypothetical protein
MKLVKNCSPRFSKTIHTHAELEKFKDVMETLFSIPTDHTVAAVCRTLADDWGSIPLFQQQAAGRKMHGDEPVDQHASEDHMPAGMQQGTSMQMPGVPTAQGMQPGGMHAGPSMPPGGMHAGPSLGACMLGRVCRLGACMLGRVCRLHTDRP